ncbi:Hypothetical predicted protein [Lecanosticta acicola]|uniref:Uncharacterized protein n=1 Tax=Lecanosticta acicola TaxID=111012 RepID=A0AAI8Z645_9PEZI|nr:Hypothetical predicted protein [Lecanosticta acicola]
MATNKSAHSSSSPSSSRSRSKDSRAATSTPPSSLTSSRRPSDTKTTAIADRTLTKETAKATILRSIGKAAENKLFEHGFGGGPLNPKFNELKNLKRYPDVNVDGNGFDWERAKDSERVQEL